MKNRRAVFMRIIISLAVLMGIVLTLTLPYHHKNQKETQFEFLGQWYTWHEAMSNWQNEILTFYDDNTYSSTVIAPTGENYKYRVAGSTIYLEGYAMYQSMNLEHQEGLLTLRADNGLVYYRTEEAAQIDLATRKTAKEDSIAEQVGKEEIKNESHSKEVAAIEDIIGGWLTESGVNISFETNNEYMLIDRNHKIKIGKYQVTSPTTMIIFDPDTQSDVSIEFTLTKNHYEADIDRLEFTSKYFDWAGTFFRYHHYNLDY
jgi:hypothetical protein